MRVSVHRSCIVCIACLVLLASCATSTSHATPTGISDFTLADGGACVQLGPHPQPPYVNIPVGKDTFLAHSEPMLAEDPHNPLHLVGGSKFFTDPAHYQFQIGTYASSDGGCTWTAGALLPGIAPGLTVTDPTFAFGPHGAVYASVLYRARSVFVFASTDGGKTFGSPLRVFPENQLIVADKPWLGVDPQSGAIVVVVSYTKVFCGGHIGSWACEEIAFMRSTDGGKTFSAPRFIEGDSAVCSNRSIADLPASFAHRCLFGIGATPVFLPNGHIAVAYLYQNPDTNASYQLVVTSADSGQTWSQPIIAATIHALPNTFPDQKYRVASLPAFAGDPQTGQLYLAWADAPHNHADILLAISHDGGQTWSQPARVNDTPATTLVNDSQPQLAIAPNGVVSVSFFDTRNDPHGHLLDVYLAQSVDHGATWLPNVRVTTASFNPDTGAPLDPVNLEFIGDYQGLAADDLFVHPFWNDTRTGKQQIFTAAIPSAQPSKRSTPARSR